MLIEDPDGTIRDTIWEVGHQINPDKNVKLLNTIYMSRSTKKTASPPPDINTLPILVPPASDMSNCLPCKHQNRQVLFASSYLYIPKLAEFLSPSGKFSSPTNLSHGLLILDRGSKALKVVDCTLNNSWRHVVWVFILLFLLVMPVRMHGQNRICCLHGH